MVVMNKKKWPLLLIFSTLIFSVHHPYFNFLVNLSSFPMNSIAILFTFFLVICLYHSILSLDHSSDSNHYRWSIIKRLFQEDENNHEVCLYLTMLLILSCLENHVVAIVVCINTFVLLPMVSVDWCYLFG